MCNNSKALSNMKPYCVWHVGDKSVKAVLVTGAYEPLKTAFILGVGYWYQPPNCLFEFRSNFVFFFYQYIVCFFFLNLWDTELILFLGRHSISVTRVYHLLLLFSLSSVPCQLTGNSRHLPNLWRSNSIVHSWGTN